MGSCFQIKDAQETDKNFICESLDIFQSQRLNKKVTEAQTELALCYWRAGEYNEASDLLKVALSQLSSDSELKAKAVLRSAIVDEHAGRLTDALRFLTENATLFEKINNDMLSGCYHQTVGDVLKDLWESNKPGDYLDRALVEYAAASYHFELAEHRRYRANVENNLGFLYLKINFFKEAHEHLDRARRIFSSLRDRGAVAQVAETRARAFLQEGRNTEAEKAAHSSVRTLEKTDMQAPLAESLTTHGRALARLEHYGMALSTFRRAIDLAQKIGCLNRAAEAALAAFQEMGERLAATEPRNVIAGRNLAEEIQSLEHDLIKHSLETNRGSITRAARALGISYQELSYMLRTRHTDLIGLRTPPRHRSSKLSRRFDL
jgi:tetratricopeptide (TPR) repeat protein